MQFCSPVKNFHEGLVSAANCPITRRPGEKTATVLWQGGRTGASYDCSVKLALNPGRLQADKPHDFPWDVPLPPGNPARGAHLPRRGEL